MPSQKIRALEKSIAELKAENEQLRARLAGDAAPDTPESVARKVDVARAAMAAAAPPPATSPAPGVTPPHTPAQRTPPPQRPAVPVAAIAQRVAPHALPAAPSVRVNKPR